jgi:hypothetical protein
VQNPNEQIIELAVFDELAEVVETSLTSLGHFVTVNTKAKREGHERDEKRMHLR